MYKHVIVSLLTLLALCSCGTDGKHFKMQGHILNMNQGELYVYNDEGAVNGLDTIKIQGGRFTYETECDHPTTLMLIFPNFSEQPIFARPGKSVDISGDASHLKMLKVEGTKDNELMTNFREQVASAAPPLMRKFAGVFVEDYPDSPVGAYLVKKYFVTPANPDLQEASRLIRLMMQNQKGNATLARLEMIIKPLRNGSVGSKLPTFTAYDMKGRLVSSSDLSNGLAVICTWASWSYESMSMLRTVKQVQRRAHGRLHVVSFSVDAAKRDCKIELESDSIAWPNVCDGMLFDSKPLQQLGLRTVPDNIIVKEGRVIARSLNAKDLQQTLEQNL